MCRKGLKCPDKDTTCQYMHTEDTRGEWLSEADSVKAARAATRNAKGAARPCYYGLKCRKVCTSSFYNRSLWIPPVVFSPSTPRPLLITIISPSPSPLRI